MLPKPWILCLLLGLALAGCGDGADAPGGGSTPGVEELDWDTLIPPDWRPETLLESLGADSLDAIGDEDPRALELMEKLRVLWSEAPVVAALDGRRVRLPGFVVPLDLEARSMRELLLVPYYGACIHVPPPPPNQTVHVIAPEGAAYEGGVFDTVWVTGTLRVERSHSELAEAGYRLEATDISPYDEGVESR